MSRPILSSFIKIIMLFQKLSVFIFYCLSKLFNFFNRCLFPFVKSAIKIVLLEIKFSTYFIDVLLETRFIENDSYIYEEIYFVWQQQLHKSHLHNRTHCLFMRLHKEKVDMMIDLIPWFLFLWFCFTHMTSKCR